MGQCPCLALFKLTSRQEQTLFGSEWDRPPNHEGIILPDEVDQFDTRTSVHRRAQRAAIQDIRDPKFRFTRAHNIWAIGKIMYDMLTLRTSQELGTFQNGINEYAYYNRGVADTFPDVNAHAKGNGYSRELCDVVSSCLRIDAGKRPTPEELRQRIAENSTRQLDAVGTATLGGKGKSRDPGQRQSQSTANPDANRLFFEKNNVSQLRNLGLRARNFTYNEGDWLSVAESPYDDRDWTPVVPASAFVKLAKNAQDWAAQKVYRPRPFPEIQGIVQLGPAAPPATVYVHLDFCNGECGNRCRLLRNIPVPVASPPTVAQQPIQDPNPPVIHTHKEYRVMTVANMKDELENYRGVPTDEVHRLKRKDDLIARLQRCDRERNPGRGVWNPPKPPKPPKQPPQPLPPRQRYVRAAKRQRTG